jgi:hypothetical protein
LHPPETLRSGLGELASEVIDCLGLVLILTAIIAGLILREPFINDPATDTAWSNALVFSLILDLLPHVQLDKVEPSTSLDINLVVVTELTID